MASTFLDRQPSALAPARVSSVLAHVAQVCVLGLRAVQVQVRTAPIPGPIPAGNGATKINNNAVPNNYMGTFAASAVERAATPVLPSSAMWAQQADKVKGGDARGIPPRGTPV